MTRLEAETKIVEHLDAIKNIYREYNPDGNHLSLCISKFGTSFNNEYWDRDKHKPVDYFRHEGNEDCHDFERIGGETRYP